MVAAQGLAVHKLVAEEVSVPYIKAGEDVNLWSSLPSSTAIVSSGTALHASYQSTDVTACELVVFSVGWREPEANKPATVKIMKKIGNFLAEISEMLVFHYILCIPCT
jgi:hypothetical protein